MLIHKSTTYVDIVSHFAFVVCFWQIQRLDVFWHAWRFAIHKWICIKFTPYLQILVDACLQASSHGYCTTVMHQITRHCLFVIFLPTTKPYSPDLVPCDFFLFPKLKRSMEERRFATIEEIKTASLEDLKTIPKSANQKCFEDWKKRWHKFIITDGINLKGTI